MAGEQETEHHRETFKQQLDRAAEERRSGTGNQQSNSIAEKITQYVPAASRVLGRSQQDEVDAANQSEEKPGPPNRPDHDHKIEDFVRDQHRSKPRDGTAT